MKWKHEKWCDKNVTISKESVEKIKHTGLRKYIPRLEFIFWFFMHQMDPYQDPVPQKYTLCTAASGQILRRKEPGKGRTCHGK